VETKKDKIDQYCDVMEDIKRRKIVIDAFMMGKCTTPYKATNLETICLQVRKILELIALGSMVANHKEFSKQHEKFHKYWHAERILNDIEKMNPSFYPQPIEKILIPQDGVKAQRVNVKDGYLTKKEFVKVYNKCGGILHADNPFGSKTDYSYYEKGISAWMTRILKLLNAHTIRLLNDENIYLIHMEEERDRKVHGYTVAPVVPKRVS